MRNLWLAGCAFFLAITSLPVAWILMYINSDLAVRLLRYVAVRLAKLKNKLEQSNPTEDQL